MSLPQANPRKIRPKNGSARLMTSSIWLLLSGGDVVAPEARLELDRIRAAGPSSRSTAPRPGCRCSAASSPTSPPGSTVPDLGPAVVVDQLTVLVWDAYATGPRRRHPGTADRGPAGAGLTRGAAPGDPGCAQADHGGGRQDYVSSMADSDVRPGGPDPDVVIVMGVSGSGKSTVAKGLSTVLGWEFAEGDAFHPEANVAKMRSGTPLTDEDRWPWLEAIGDWISAKEERGESAVVTCSALRRVYRDLLREGRPHVRFLHVTAESDVILDRMEHRPGHYMPPSLLPSQLATLEPLGDDEPGVAITNEGSAAQVLDRALAALGHRKEHA